MKNVTRIIITLLKELNWKTIYFNFKYLPFNQAVHLPIFVSNNVYLRYTKGRIKLECSIKTRLIKIGYKGVGIFDHKRSRSIWNVSGTIIFKGKTVIGHGTKLSVGKNATLILGEQFTITSESSIFVSEKTIEFGSNCLLSWDILIMDTDVHKIYNEKNEQINMAENVNIGNHVWIGCRCLILKGSNIPSNSIIAANSLISRPLIGENKIFGGQPAEQLKDNVTWVV